MFRFLKHFKSSLFETTTNSENFLLNGTSFIFPFEQDKNLKTLNILDVGCGGGLVSESLSKLGAKVTGVDFIEYTFTCFIRQDHFKVDEIKVILRDVLANCSVF